MRCWAQALRVAANQAFWEFIPKEGLVIHANNAGAMNWRAPAGQLSNLPAGVENLKAELHQIARAKLNRTPLGESYAGAKMRE